MPTILLVRHGQASFGAADYDELSSAGVQQAAVVARHLRSLPLNVGRIVSGGLRRQRDTAAPAALSMARELVVDPRWDEYAMDQILATYSGTDVRASVTRPEQVTSSDEYQRVLDVALGAWIAAGDDSVSGCETWAAFAGRARAALTEFAGLLEPGQTGLAFTSGGVIAALCVALLELPATAMPSFNRVTVNTGISKLICGRRGMTLVSFNDHSHLELWGEAITYR